jgi:hypothetical protein
MIDLSDGFESRYSPQLLPPVSNVAFSGCQYRCDQTLVLRNSGDIACKSSLTDSVSGCIAFPWPLVNEREVTRIPETSQS